ncbi:hypothetical protein ACSBR1_012312 [Camellia fascicularis]
MPNKKNFYNKHSYFGVYHMQSILSDIMHCSRGFDSVALEKVDREVVQFAHYLATDVRKHFAD